jgi:hypothetical protein
VFGTAPLHQSTGEAGEAALNTQTLVLRWSEAVASSSSFSWSREIGASPAPLHFFARQPTPNRYSPCPLIHVCPWCVATRASRCLHLRRRPGRPPLRPDPQLPPLYDPLIDSPPWIDPASQAQRTGRSACEPPPPSHFSQESHRPTAAPVTLRRPRLCPLRPVILFYDTPARSPSLD